MKKSNGVTHRCENQSEALEAEGSVGSIMDDTVILGIFVVHAVDDRLDEITFVQANLVNGILGRICG